MTDLASLATVDDLTARSARTLTDAELDRAPALLASASAAVRRFCRRDFIAVEDDTLRLKPVGNKVILPNGPVTAVSAVKRVNFDGTMTALAGWVWDGGDTVYVDSTGSPMINAPEQWTDDPYTPMVEVTWDHGDGTSIDVVVVDVVCSMVLRVLNSTGVEGMTGESAGPFSYRADPSPGSTAKLSTDDKQRLRDSGYTTARSATTVMLR